MKLKTAKRLSLLIFALLLIASGIKLGLVYRHNWLSFYGNPNIGHIKYGEQFLQTEYSAVEHLNPQNDTLIFGRDALDKFTVVLENDINYYTRSDSGAGYTLAHTIPKGTRVYAYIPYVNGFFVYHAECELGYGFRTLPTFERGWRYARPFIVAEYDEESPEFYSEKNNVSVAEMPYYYVRLSALEPVAREFVEANSYYDETLGNIPKDVMTRYELLRYDIIAYAQGWICTLDVYLPYFDTLQIVMLAGMGVCIIAFVLITAREKRAARECEDDEKKGEDN